MKKLGRNDNCYCGSGIKLKKCCNTAEKVQQRETDAKAKTQRLYEEKEAKRDPGERLRSQMMIASLLGMAAETLSPPLRRKEKTFKELEADFLGKD